MSFKRVLGAPVEILVRRPYDGSGPPKDEVIASYFAGPDLASRFRARAMRPTSRTLWGPGGVRSFVGVVFVPRLDGNGLSGACD